MASFASVPAKGLPPRPPDKGSFPLDHFRECSDMKQRYLDCLGRHGMDTQADECRKLTSAYLECRMDACALRTKPVACLPTAPSQRPACARTTPLTTLAGARSNLMAREDVKKLGMHETPSAPLTAESGARQQQRAGYIAGRRPPASDAGERGT